MAINLQIDKFGAQFSAFVEFASAQKHENYIACIEGQKPGRGVPGLLMSILSHSTASAVTTAFHSAIERPGLPFQRAGNSAGPAERPRLTASAGV